jgi:hypothetical protein
MAENQIFLLLKETGTPRINHINYIHTLTHVVASSTPYNGRQSNLLSHGTLKYTLKTCVCHFVLMIWLLLYLYLLHTDFFTLENII